MHSTMRFNASLLLKHTHGQPCCVSAGLQVRGGRRMLPQPQKPYSRSPKRNAMPIQTSRKTPTIERVKVLSDKEGKYLPYLFWFTTHEILAFSQSGIYCCFLPNGGISR